MTLSRSDVAAVIPSHVLCHPGIGWLPGPSAPEVRLRKSLPRGRMHNTVRAGPRDRGEALRGTKRIATESSSAQPPREGGLVHATPVYYGWIILVAGALGLIMTSPGQTYAFSIFLEHFIADLGLNRTAVSSLYTGGTLAASLLLPLVGKQADRRGSRTMVVLIVALLGASCIYMGLVRGALMLVVGFTLLRLLGQQSLALVSNNVINRWWVRKRGMALGIAGLLTSLIGFGGFPNLIAWLIRQIGWRLTYGVLGVLVWLVMLPVGWILFRDQPEDYGLEPDGVSAVDQAAAHRNRWIEENWTPKEATRTPAFWILSLGLASTSMLSTGLTFHAVSIFQDSGLGASAAALAFVPMASVTALVNLASGILVDRIPIKLLLAGGLVAQAIALVMAPRLGGAGMALAYGVMMGVVGGMMRTMGSVVWAHYFGRRHLGAIMGIASMISSGSSALGPLPMGIARDLLGDYRVTLTVLAVLPLALAIASLSIKRPQRVSP